MGRFLAPCILAVLLLVGSRAFALEREEFEAPVIFSADELTHDRNLGVVTASGHVEVVQGKRILLADKVIYNQREDTVAASGNVSLLEPTGEVLFADYLELSDQLREGVISGIRVLLSDHSRLAATGARRTGGNRTEMSKAVYSPCELCPEDRERPPLWQIKAFKVVHDQEKHTISYRDAFLELFGIPVAYTPYFSHPDPTVERKTGFLAPVLGTSSFLGLTLQTPYYFAIQPHRDATFAPMFTTKEGVLWAGQYRERTRNGTFQLEGSITRVDKRDETGERVSGKDDTRGHIFGFGRFDLSDAWSWGFDLERSTDDTFLRRYDISDADTLTSRLFVEGIEGRRFLSANAYSFQGLAADDDPDETPQVLPLVDYQYISDPLWGGSYWSIDANALVLRRNDPTESQGTDSRRVSLAGGWHINRIGPIGDVYDFSVSLRGDLYWVRDVPDVGSPGRESFDGLTGRAVPEVKLEWRYPWISYHGGLRQVIEPVVMVIVSPFGGNPEQIPNEDSQDFEFDDTNLFSTSRFTGLDRIEGGPRINYGLRWGLYGSNGARVSALVGQSYRVKDDDTFRSGSGLDDNSSDFVGRIDARPNEYLDLLYRFRFDKDELEAKRNEVSARLGPRFLRLDIDYVFLDAEESRADQPAFDDREEINLRATLRVSDYWRLVANNRRSLTEDAGTLEAGGGIVYEDECFVFSLQGKRRFTRDRELEPETRIIFSVQFKHLGSPSGVAIGSGA